MPQAGVQQIIETALQPEECEQAFQLSTVFDLDYESLKLKRGWSEHFSGTKASFRIKSSFIQYSIKGLALKMTDKKH